MNGRFMSAFDALKGDSAWSAEYISIVTGIALDYKQNVMDRWQESHDRTGATLETFKMAVEAITNFELDIGITVAGNVGFVIHPLPPHEIGAAGQILTGPSPYREAYSDFGPIHGPVAWYQGGPESQSPDLTWFQDAAEALAGLGASALQKVAVKVNEQALGLMMVDGELVTGMVDTAWDIQTP